MTDELQQEVATAYSQALKQTWKLELSAYGCFLAGYKAAAESLQPRLDAALKLLDRPEVMAVLGLEEVK